MNLKRIFLMVVAVFFLGTPMINNALAAWSFNLEAIDETNFELNFLSDEGAIALTNFTLYLGYSDNVEIDNYSFIRPSGYMAMGLDPVDDKDTNIWGDLTAIAFDAGIADGQTLATFEMSIFPNVSKDGKIDIWFDYTNSNFGVGLSDVPISGEALWMAGSLTYQNAQDLDVGSVPIPSSILLLGAGFCGLIGTAKRKS